MIERKRFAVNRILCPDLPLAAFFGIAGKLRLGGVELRNDLGRQGVIDGLDPREVRELAAKSGVEVLTINALQKFDMASVRGRSLSELKELASLAQDIGCRAIVFCPTNDRADRRSAASRFRETAESLAAYAPILIDHGLLGYVEPLGFEECALRSKVDALAAIEESRADCFKIVHDTFHHKIGPDSFTYLEGKGGASRVGLVHLSGVAEDLPLCDYRDMHRILPGGTDRMENRAQLQVLLSRGYEGPLSFEPFASEVQSLSRAAVEEAVAKSIDYVSA